VLLEKQAEAGRNQQLFSYFLFEIFQNQNFLLFFRRNKTFQQAACFIVAIIQSNKKKRSRIK
jgi:hypothetical protein